MPDLTTVPDPAPGYPRGWRLALPVAEMDVYLEHLVARLERAGGTLTRHWLAELPASGVVVNASGLASRALAGDGTLHPVRGQVVQVAQTGVEEWLLESSDEDRPLYVVPREHDVVVGGTADDGSWDLRPDPETATAILARATALVPGLRGAEVLGHRVGLRPARPAVRLEAVPHAGRRVRRGRALLRPRRRGGHAVLGLRRRRARRRRGAARAELRSAG